MISDAYMSTIVDSAKYVGLRPMGCCKLQGALYEWTEIFDSLSSRHPCNIS